MPTKPIPPTLAESLRSLADSQLQTQVSRSATLEAGALAVTAVDAALARNVVNTGVTGLWITTLALLGLSLSLAVRAVRLPGATHTGSAVAKTLELRGAHDDRELEESILTDLANSVDKNERTLARKAILFDQALVFMILAIAIELTGRL